MHTHYQSLKSISRYKVPECSGNAQILVKFIFHNKLCHDYRNSDQFIKRYDDELAPGQSLSQGNSLAQVYVNISIEGKILLTAISRVCYGTDPKLDENRDPKSGFHAFSPLPYSNHRKILRVNVNHCEFNYC